MPRIARPTRAVRRHTRPQPPTAHRRRRGPKPPPQEWIDELAAQPRERRRGALLVALAWLALRARRGVQQAFALAPDALELVLLAPGPSAPAEWVNDTLDAMTAADARHPADPALRAAALAAVVGNAVMAVFANAVAHFARAAGSETYLWTTHNDRSKSGTRHLHKELEDTVQRWNDPPIAGTDGFVGHPGEAAGPCVCTAWPLPPPLQ